ncbi:hypothetical protein MTO96_022984 [Rhipicephalus appendiculatus]
MKNRAAIANILLLGALVVPYLPAVAGVCHETSKFDCGNGRCVLSSWLCDGDDDCGNNADEEGCDSKVCPQRRFACHNGKLRVIPSFVCDGDDDCGDGSDEKNCPEARVSALDCSLSTRPEPTSATPSADTAGPSSPPSDWNLNDGGISCRDGRCLRPVQVCDGVRDCSDGFDEGFICGHFSRWNHQQQHELLDHLVRWMPCQTP